MAGRSPSLHLFPSSSQPSHRTLGTPPPSPPQQILYTEQKIDIHTKKRVPATCCLLSYSFNTHIMQTTCRTRTLTLSIQQYNTTLRSLPVHPHLYLHWRTCYHYHWLHSCFAPIERGFLGASRSKWYYLQARSQGGFGWFARTPR